MSLEKIVDPYDLRARFYPMIIVLMPLALGLSAWVPAEDVGRTLGGAVIAISGAGLLGHLARDAGKKREQELFQRWQEVPSIRALSYRGQTFDAATIRRFHGKLRALDPNLNFPVDAEAELEHWDQSQKVYQSANELLLARTNNEREKFRLVFSESVSYGFRRNLWAMKGTGIVTSVVGLLTGAIKIGVDLQKSGETASSSGIAIAASLLLLILWICRVSPRWVKLAADSFGKQLVRSCEMFHSPK